MEKHGFEAPLSGTLNTFPVLRRHLDWIFVRDLSPLEARVEFAPFSDHNAVWVRVRL
jgi:endonuclease/exonuclease/phosphatase (EEP) superfamily protein YafD